MAHRLAVRDERRVDAEKWLAVLLEQLTLTVAHASDEQGRPPSERTAQAGERISIQLTNRNIQIRSCDASSFRFSSSCSVIHWHIIVCLSDYSSTPLRLGVNHLELPQGSDPGIGDEAGSGSTVVVTPD